MARSSHKAGPGSATTRRTASRVAACSARCMSIHGPVCPGAIRLIGPWATPITMGMPQAPTAQARSGCKEGIPTGPQTPDKMAARERDGDDCLEHAIDVHTFAGTRYEANDQCHDSV